MIYLPSAKFGRYLGSCKFQINSRLANIFSYFIVKPRKRMVLMSANLRQIANALLLNRKWAVSNNIYLIIPNLSLASCVWPEYRSGPTPQANSLSTPCFKRLIMHLCSGVGLSRQDQLGQVWWNNGEIWYPMATQLPLVIGY